MGKRIECDDHQEFGARVRGAVSRFVGDRLGTRRSAAGLTVAEVAAVVGVSESTIYKWEAGAVRPNPRHLRALAEALEVDPVVFIRTTGTPNLQELRERCALSLDEVAPRTGVGRSTLHRIEHGSVRPSPTVRAGLADAYQVEPSLIDEAWERATAALRARATRRHDR